MTSLEKLKEDKYYYGRFGKQFLSNSNIYVLLNNPKAFLDNSSEQTLPMLHGRYLHTAILEEDKLDQFTFVDASTRNTNIYKNASNGELLMLLKEKETLDLSINAIRSNKRFYEDIYADGNIYEEPGISMILGNEWKGKADIITKDKIIDIKTTNDINSFARSAYSYNYDSQAFIYQTLFGKPLEFYVVDKNTQQLGIFTCSDEFLERGYDKVVKATAVYNKFFKGDEDIEQYYIEGHL